MISGILLAGGQSQRMGENKAFMKYRGRELFRYPLDILTGLCDEIFISGPPDLFPAGLPYPVIADVFPGKGPIGGIYSCLKRVKNPLAVVLSCDIPFISNSYIKALLSATDGSGVVAGIDRQGRPQPLAAIYSQSVWPVMEKHILEGRLKMADVLDVSSARLIDVAEMGFDPDRLFFNVNKREDFDALDQQSPAMD